MLKLVVAFATLVVFATESYLPSAIRQMGDVGPFLKMAWRAEASVLLLMPIAVYESRQQGVVWLSLLLKRPSGLVSLAFACMFTGAAWVGAFGLFSLSLSLTSLTHATLTAVAMPPVYLAAWAALVRGERLSPPEIGGVLLAVGGICLAVTASSSTGGTSGPGASAASVAGDVVGLCSAALGATFALSIENVRSTASMPLFAFQTAWMTCALPLTLLLPLLLGEASASGHGLLDWARGSYWPQVPHHLRSCSTSDPALHPASPNTRPNCSHACLRQVLFLALGMGVASNTCMTIAAQEAGSLALGLIWCLSPVGARCSYFPA